jgi:excisionase family DNA binding protein
MKNITFDNLPEAVNEIQNKLLNIEQLILANGNAKKFETDNWFNLAELCNYHPDKPKKATVYGWVHEGKIPVHKGGKKLRFLKSEIDKFIKQGRKKSVAETEIEVENYLKRKGGKNE